ncbi:X-ray radiation resistance-associated protein 1 isoform 2-T3 [Liasis olivaceus]
MTTKGMYKLDNGQCFPTNCFPAKSLLQPRYEEGSGHWQVAHHSTEKTKIEWLFGTRAARLNWKRCLREAYSPRAEKTLSGAQLIKLHHVKKPSDLCSVNISHQNFALAKEEDFVVFDSVAYINATENLLTLEIFRKFPGLRELELSLNGLRNLKVNVGDFPHLEILDLSYNNLSPNDVQTLGILPHLKVLHLTANGLSSLPLDLAASESESCPRFPALEVLLLDDNHLSHSDVFVSLANLRSLKQLNLDKNGIKEVPYLHYVDSAHFSIHPLSAKSGIQAGLCCRKNAKKKLHQDRSPRLSQQYSYIIGQNDNDPDRTEVIFQARSSELMAQERPPSPLADSKASRPNINTEFILPLPELRFLSLANNQIEHEEDLLAVALFPSLTELTFHGNPFTTSRSGDPPLLTSFLQNKLGIKLVRKKVSKLEKPRIFIPVKANREIKSQLPKVQKRPLRIETALETTFWQLWTGADLDPNKRMSLDKVGPVPKSRSFSFFYDPEQPILSTLKREERSASFSLTSLASEILTPRSSQEGLSGNNIPHRSSLDEILAGNVSPSQFSLEQSQSEVLSPCGSASQGQGHSGFTTPAESFSVDQVLSEPPLQLESLSESSPSMKTPLAEQLPQVHLETVPPANSPLEERELSELVLIVGPKEQDISKTLLSASSIGEQSELASITLPQQKQSKPVVPSETVVEEDLGMPLSPVTSFSVEKNLQEAFPPSGSSTEEQDQQEAFPPSGSSTEEQDQQEAFPPSGSSTEEQDQQEVFPPSGSSTEKRDQQEPTLFSYSGGEDLSECISLIGSSARHLPEVHLPTISLVDEDQAEPSLLPTLVFQDMNLSDSSKEQEHPGFPPPSSSLVEHGQKKTLTLAELSSLRKSSPLLFPPSRSDSRELYELFARAQSYALPPEPEDGISTEKEMHTSSIEDVTEMGKSEPIFMTQVDESIGSRLSSEKKAESPRVPEKFKGYEELLGGDPGSDFVEPKGIQQNVQALEKALRYPLVHREPKARLDCFQKPYVSPKKKVLRVPAPVVQKTRMERLEEILLELRKPTNIVHIPLVCILRRKKGNWREYREALELLKEFQEEYKSVVATCNMISESRSFGKEQVTEDAVNHIQKLQSLPEVKVRRKLEESSVQVLQENNDFLPSCQ